MKKIYFVILKIFRFSVFWMNPQTSKSVTISLKLQHIRSQTFDCLFRILASAKMKFVGRLIQLIVIISDLFLALLWKIETNCRSFYEFDKMTVKCDQLVFCECLLLLLVSMHSFETGQTHCNWFFDLLR